MPGAFAPSARTGPSTSSRSRGGGKRRSRPGGAQLTVPRVRWDRLGRLAMLFVLAALLYLYLSAGTRMFSTWHQSRHDSATVASMEREHASLVRQREALGRQGTVEEQARRLGMKKANERAYVITGLPAN
jgi:hypothetical protein